MNNRLIVTTVIFLLSISVIAEEVAYLKENVKNNAIFPNIPLKCSANHYVWAGTWHDANNKSHNLSVEKKINSKPLENVIILKGDKLMVDNDEFKIIRADKNEVFAIYIDDKNVLIANLIYNQGKLIYTKAFANNVIPGFGTGKNNSMSYVAECHNY